MEKLTELLQRYPQLEGCKAEIAFTGEEKIRLEGVLALKNGQLDAILAQKNEAQEEKDKQLSRIKELTENAAAAELELVSLQKDLDSFENKLASLTGDREELQQKREQVAEKVSAMNLVIATAETEIEAKIAEKKSKDDLKIKNYQ